MQIQILVYHLKDREFTQPRLITYSLIPRHVIILCCADRWAIDMMPIAITMKIQRTDLLEMVLGSQYTATHKLMIICIKIYVCACMFMYKHGYPTMKRWINRRVDREVEIQTDTEKYIDIHGNDEIKNTMLVQSKYPDSGCYALVITFDRWPSIL